MYYRISKNEKNLVFGKKIAQVWAVTLKAKNETWFYAKETVSSCAITPQYRHIACRLILETSAK